MIDDPARPRPAGRRPGHLVVPIAVRPAVPGGGELGVRHGMLVDNAFGADELLAARRRSGRPASTT